MIDIGMRYKENPFLKDLMIPTTTKNVKVTPLGKDRAVVVNQETGEVQGTHVTTRKVVDAEEFVKLFTKNIALTFNLTASGIKALSVLIYTVQKTGINKDSVCLDKYTLDEFLESHKQKNLKLSHSTFKRGVNDLEKAGILAKQVRPGWYYTNPDFVFSGDRIVFSTVIEREEPKKEISNESTKS